jgi:hypothetical protein
MAFDSVWSPARNSEGVEVESRLLPSDQPIYRDGRNICTGCKRTGIFRQDALEAIYKDVLAYLGTSLKMKVDRPPPVQIADYDEIQTKFVEGGRSMEVAGFYRPFAPEMIYILSGYQKVRVTSTLCHEYTHAWQSRNCPLQDRALKEGFACWVQYRYLINCKERAEADALLRCSDPDYGESLVKCLDLERRLGIDGLLRFVKKENNFKKE